jgi:hypothetical protein
MHHQNTGSNTPSAMNEAEVLREQEDMPLSGG